MKALALSAMAVLLATQPIMAQVALPEGVTEAMVLEGETYFRSIGLCFACHGVDAKGVPGVGADLTDTEWYHGDGSFPSLVDQILEGVSPQVSKTGVMMPPKGGSQITVDQARAIAGYVWTLSHLGGPDGPAG